MTWLPRKWWPDEFVTPTDLTSSAYVTDHVAVISLTGALLVAGACFAVWIVAQLQGDGAESTFKAHRALWAENLRAADQELTVEVRDGRTFRGYIAGNTTDESGTETPTLYLSPPVFVTDAPAMQKGLNRKKNETRIRRYRGHAVLIPGSEIVAVWRSYTDDDAIKAGANPKR